MLRKIQKDKKGIEAIRDVVIIIIAIIVLILGVVFITKMHSKSEKLVESEIETKTLESERFLVQTELEEKNLALSKNSFAIKRGKKQKFIIGFKNTEATDSALKIVIEDLLEDTFAREMFIYKEQETTLKPSEKYYNVVVIQPPATMPSGIYLFEVKLLSGNNVLNSEQFTVNIEG